MADTADIAAEIAEEVITDAVRRARNTILAGTAGECEECEWWMPRLVDGRCGFCRDGRQRPPDWEPPPRPDAIVITVTEEKPMPAKSVQLPASAATAIFAVEALAFKENISLGVAAAQLIERGLVAPIAGDASASEEPHLSMRERFFAAVDVVAGLAAELLNQPDAGAATARAEVAERLASGLRDQLESETARANAVAGKLDVLRRHLAD